MKRACVVVVSFVWLGASAPACGPTVIVETSSRGVGGAGSGESATAVSSTGGSGGPVASASAAGGPVASASSASAGSTGAGGSGAAPPCSITLPVPDKDCAACLGTNAGCCAAFTACDQGCQQCLVSPSAPGCAANMQVQAVETCLNVTCGMVCAVSVCGLQLGYPTAACNFCVSNPTTGCCMQLDACVQTNGLLDMTKQCFKCLSGADAPTSPACTGDAAFTAYSTCYDGSCATICNSNP